jgi:hypothetical protein
MGKLFDRLGLLYDRRFVRRFMHHYRIIDFRLYYLEDGRACLKVCAPAYDDAFTIIDFFEGRYLAYNKVAAEIAEIIEGFLGIKLGDILLIPVQRLQRREVLVVNKTGHVQIIYP